MTSFYRYRQFRLINSVGEEYDLCDLDHAFYSPDGLGFQRNISAVQVGDAFAPVDNKLAQQVIKGEMRFRSYELYSGFKEFISSGGLTLAYLPKGMQTWYYRNIEVQRLDKSEIDRTAHRLICPIDFLAFSQWYEKANAKKTIDLTGENTVFPLVFPWVFSDAEKNELLLVNERISPAPCKIIISGPCVNPAWTLRQDGRTIAKGGMTMSIAAGEKLVIDSNIESMGIIKITSAGSEVNAYQYSDFSTGRFIFAPTGESRLKFTHSTTAALDVTVEVRQVSDTV
jgi:hypothetical protein